MCPELLHAHVRHCPSVRNLPSELLPKVQRHPLDLVQHVIAVRLEPRDHGLLAVDADETPRFGVDEPSLNLVANLRQRGEGIPGLLWRSRQLLLLQLELLLQ